MHNGRPLDKSYATFFNSKGYTQCAFLFRCETDVSGWQYYSGQVNKEGTRNGRGKEWMDDGSIEIGRYEYNNYVEGRRYELQPDGSRTLF